MNRRNAICESPRLVFSKQSTLCAGRQDKHWRRRILSSFFTCMALAIAVPGAAYAVECGDTLGPGGVFRLHSNLTCELRGTGGPSPVVALTLVGPATLDLKGHVLTCINRVSFPVPVSTIGIRAEGHGARIKNGYIKDCDVGVSLEGHGGHRAVNMVAVAGGDVGFGSTLDTVNNLFSRNTAVGFGVAGFTIGSGDRLWKNSVTNNPVGYLNFSSDTRLIENVATANDIGFLVFGQNNRLLRNEALANERSGIEVRGIQNTMIGNAAVGNGDGISSFDLLDEHPECDANRWRRNTFNTRSQDCIE